MTDKTFSNASNARRAARAAGYELDAVEIVQDGARFSFRPLAKGDTADEAPGTDELAQVVSAAPAAEAAPEQDDAPVASEAPAPAAPVIYEAEPLGAPKPGDCVLVIAALVPADSAVMWAAQYAKRTGQDIEVRDALTMEVRRVVAAKAPKVRKEKAERVPGAPRAGSRTADMLSALKGDQGATLDELTALAGWASGVGTGNVYGMAKRAGLTVEAMGGKGGSRRFRLVAAA